MTHLTCDFCGKVIIGNWVRYGVILFHSECFLVYLKLMGEDKEEEDGR